MPNDKKTKVIFFDAGGTLFRPYPSVGEVYARTAWRHGVSVKAETVEKAFYARWHERNGLSALSGETSEKIERDWWYHLVRDVFGQLDSFRDFDTFFEELYDLFGRAECWRLFDDALPVLDTLKAAGYRMGIISNWDHRLFSIVDQLNLSSYFDHVTASSAVGVAKPGAGIFQHALDFYQVTPDLCLHVGDSLVDDYQGARAVGMQAVLLDRHAKPYNDTVRIDSLLKLPDLLS
ncbi:MAG: HAD-IA family hydrolase [Elusimicrobiota bacterium]|jgi:putative hydrolase of the HAD superfamily